VYDYSLKRQQIAPKKVYCIDTGLVNAVGFHFSANTGKLLENLVFLTLRQQTKEIYYYITPGGYEVDFYLPERRQLIHVSQRIENSATRERELCAREDAIKVMPVESVLILADTNENETSVGGTPVKIQAISEWLVKQS
jgi:predicted AAA+ superfamily ATPase